MRKIKLKFFVISFMLFLLFVPFLSPYELFVSSEFPEKIEIGETIKMDFGIGIQDYSGFKPIIPINLGAKNIKVMTLENKTVFFEVFEEKDNEKFQDYLDMVCSKGKDDFKAYDGGWEIEWNDEYGTHFLETSGGYCEYFRSRYIPENSKIILLNKTGITFPSETFLISFELPKDPLDNTICENEIYPNRTISYFLPENAWIWANTSFINTALVEDNDDLIATIDFSIVSGQKICFSYGTEDEYQTYKNKANEIIYILLFSLIIPYFLGMISFGNNLKKYSPFNVYFISFLVFLAFLVIFRYILPYSSNLIPPFFHKYIYYVNFILWISLIVHISILALAIYKKDTLRIKDKILQFFSLSKY